MLSPLFLAELVAKQSEEEYAVILEWLDNLSNLDDSWEVLEALRLWCGLNTFTCYIATEFESGTLYCRQIPIKLDLLNKYIRFCNKTFHMSMKEYTQHDIFVSLVESQDTTLESILLMELLLGKELYIHIPVLDKIILTPAIIERINQRRVDTMVSMNCCDLYSLPDTVSNMLVVNSDFYIGLGGIKVMGQANTRQKLYRANYFLSLIKLHNMLELPMTFCIKNCLVYNVDVDETIEVMTDAKIELLLQGLKRKCEETGIVYRDIPACRAINSDIYADQLGNVSVYTTNTLIALRAKRKEVLAEAIKGLDQVSVLDIGCGRGNDYSRLRSKLQRRLVRYIGMDPSEASLPTDTPSNTFFFQGVGDENWRSHPQYKVVLENRYNIILMSFTIHYMLNNLSVLLDNIKQVLSKGTRICIMYVDTSESPLPITVRVNKLVLYHVEDYSIEENKIMVYFKDVYGVSQGSIEYKMSHKVIDTICTHFGMKAKLYSFADDTQRDYVKSVTQYHFAAILE